MCVCVQVSVQVPIGVRKMHWIPWIWMNHLMWMLDPNSGPLLLVRDLHH